MSDTATLVVLATSHCDRCGAAGQTRFVLPSGQDLVFCGHHSNAYGIELVAASARPQEVRP